MRSKKTGSDLELSVMQSFSRTLKELPAESRNRVVNWVSSQDWSTETLAPKTATAKADAAALS